MAGGNSVDIKALETALGQVTSTFRSLSDKMDASTNVLDAIKDILGDTNANIAKNTSGKSKKVPPLGSKCPKLPHLRNR